METSPLMLCELKDWFLYDNGLRYDERVIPNFAVLTVFVKKSVYSLL